MCAAAKLLITLLIMRHVCLGGCCHHVMFQIGRPCTILPTKSQSIGAAQAQNPCGPWRPCINKTRPGAKAIKGPLATWRWLLWTQPAGTDEPGTLAAKNRKEIETGRGVRETRNKKEKKEEASEDFLMMLYLSAACLTGGTTHGSSPDPGRISSMRPSRFIMDKFWRRRWTHSHIHTAHTHTHIHTHVHTHVDTTRMQTYSMQMAWSCAALKQTRELSVHETVPTVL